MRLALYQPDIPQNTGAMIRLATCLGIDVDIIEPCGFPFSVKELHRAGMDYLDHANIIRHSSWGHFQKFAKNSGARVILLTTKSYKNYTKIKYFKNDIILMGRESAGAPEEVHNFASERVLIPMKGGLRSLNVATSAAMVLGEALRQINI